MVPVVAPRFDLAACNSEAERAFIEAIHARAEAGGWYADAWPRAERVVLSVCPFDSDPAYNCVLRTLRVDFDGAAVWFGPDETHQFVTDLDPARPGVSVLSGRPVAELAAAAADWLEGELRRPIVRHEWDRLDGRGVAPRLWVLADTGQAIVAHGQRSPDFGPPDRVVAVTG
jgi:hypothetical protein